MLKEIVTDSGLVKVISDTVGKLKKQGMFHALLEVAARRSELQRSDKPLETSALTAAWHSGYVSALFDLFEFKERFVEPEPESKPGMDFGAVLALYKSGEITQEEYFKLTKGA